MNTKSSNAKKTPKMAYVYINASHYFRTGEALIAVGTTLEGISQIEAQIASSDDLFHLRVFVHRLGTNDYVEYTRNDEAYLAYVHTLAFMREERRNENYLKTIYSDDKRGRLDDE